MMSPKATPVYEETVELDLSNINVDDIALDGNDWYAIGTRFSGEPYRIYDAHSKEAGAEPQARLDADPWFVLACLQCSSEFAEKSVRFTLNFSGNRVVVRAPLRSLLGGRWVGDFGGMHAVDPNAISSVKDAMNPYATPFDRNIIARLLMKQVIGNFSSVFDSFDFPTAVEFAARTFPGALMDRDTKTLTLSRAVFDAFPNHSLYDWRNISENCLEMGWKVVFT